MRSVAAALRVAVVAFLCAGMVAACAQRPSPPPPVQDLVDATVYLTSSVTDEQQRLIGVAIGAIPGASEVVYESSEQAYERFKAQFASAPDLVAATRPESLPASYRFRLPRTGADAAVDELRVLPGVSDVVIDRMAPPVGGSTPTK